MAASGISANAEPQSRIIKIALIGHFSKLCAAIRHHRKINV